MQKRLIHLSIIFFLLCPALVVAQNSPLETQLKKAIEGKKAEIGIAVIIDGQDTITVNNDIHYPMMSVFKFHQALALDRKSTRLNSSHIEESRMPSSA